MSKQKNDFAPSQTTGRYDRLDPQADNISFGIIWERRNEDEIHRAECALEQLKIHKDPEGALDLFEAKVALTAPNHEVIFFGNDNRPPDKFHGTGYQTYTIKTTLHAFTLRGKFGILFKIGEKFFTFFSNNDMGGGTAVDWRNRYEDVTARNKRLGIEPPTEELEEITEYLLEKLAESKSKRANSKAEKLPAKLPQSTFIESHACTHALSDAPSIKAKTSNWASVEGLIAYSHRPPEAGKRGVEVRFEPQKFLRDHWGQDPTLDQLQKELLSRDFDDIILFYVVLSAVLHAPNARWSVSLDQIIKLIGRDDDARQSTQKREELRSKVWVSLLVFDSWLVIGARKSGNWYEPQISGQPRLKVSPQKLYSRDPLMRIVGAQGDEGFAYNGVGVPKTVSIVPGEWAMRFYGDRRMLSEMGNILQIAQIPRGKPSGAWASCAGLLLQQLWREEATRAAISRIGDENRDVLNFRTFTRRELLANTVKSDYDIHEILADEKNWYRAKEYWTAAVRKLTRLGILGFYREEEKPLSNDPRKAWLDQPLTMRPKQEIHAEALEINTTAKEAKKRGRKKKEVPTSQQSLQL